MVRSLDFIFHAILPKDKKFFPLFDQAIANLVETAQVFETALKSDSLIRIQAHDKIEELEHIGDEITHAITHEAASTFIVPFDREDVQLLAIAIDDVVDFIYSTSKIIDLYKVHHITPDMIRMAEIITESSKELQQAIIELRSLRNIVAVRNRINKISALENEADRIVNDSIVRLFGEEKDPMRLLKAKEVITFLEIAVDKCKEASYVIESVIIKFS